MHESRFTIETLELGPMENFIYLIHDKNTSRAAVVDPAWDPEKIIQCATEKDLVISDILLTHSHHDHINGIEAILDKFDSQVHLLKAEAKFWGHYQDLPSLHHGGDEILLGDTRIKIHHTPGHTPGSACYEIDSQLITGDTLFIYGCGRCDLHGGDAEAMYHTLHHIAEHFPSETTILPGHNYAHVDSTSLAQQLEGNPFMHFDNVKKFIHYRMVEHNRETPYDPVPR